MLESGIGSLSFAESRAHFGLWVIMAQPLYAAMLCLLSLSMLCVLPLLWAVARLTPPLVLLPRSHLGLDVRNLTSEFKAMLTNAEVLKHAADPLVKMGLRADIYTSGGRLSGSQVWARELSDGSRLVGLLNAGSSGGASVPDTCTWERRAGGFLQCKPATAAENYKCWPPKTSLAAMKADCCAAGTEYIRIPRSRILLQHCSFLKRSLLLISYFM